MTTHLSGPVDSTNGFVGALTGAVTGNVTGNLTGGITFPTATVYSGSAAADKAIDPGIFHAVLTKATAGEDYTVAAPGAANVSKILHIRSQAPLAHVVTVTGLQGGTTMTSGSTGGSGNNFTMLAASATIWDLLTNTGWTQST